MRLHEREAALLLAYDIVQLAALLLFLTGGARTIPSPFLFIVAGDGVGHDPAARHGHSGWACSRWLCGGVLAYVPLPLPWQREAPLDLPPLYIVGDVGGAGLRHRLHRRLCAAASPRKRAQMSNALAATETGAGARAAASALDGLAAAAAHELGTPLATIALVAKELKREIPAPRPR